MARLKVQRVVVNTWQGLESTAGFIIVCLVIKADAVSVAAGPLLMGSPGSKDHDIQTIYRKLVVLGYLCFGHSHPRVHRSMGLDDLVPARVVRHYSDPPDNQSKGQKTPVIAILMKRVLFTILWVIVALLTAAFLSGVVAFVRSLSGHDLSQDTWSAMTAKFGAMILATGAVLLGTLGRLPGTKSKSTE